MPSHFAIVGDRTHQMAVIVKVQSEKGDDILKSIYDSLKETLDQFSKTKPALIACYVEGILPQQWETLKGKTGLSVMTSSFLYKEDGRYIHTVAYSSEEEIVKNGSIEEFPHPVLFYHNENSLYYNGQDIFSLKSDRYCNFGRRST